MEQKTESLKKRARSHSELSNKMRDKGYVLCTEVAKTIGVHKTTVYRWVKTNRVKYHDFNGAYYIEWESVLQLMGPAAKVLGFDAPTQDTPEPKRTGKLRIVPEFGLPQVESR
jgi:excisionase family DNA binding protein